MNVGEMKDYKLRDLHASHTPQVIGFVVNQESESYGRSGGTGPTPMDASVVMWPPPHY